MRATGMCSPGVVTTDRFVTIVLTDENAAIAASTGVAQTTAYWYHTTLSDQRNRVTAVIQESDASDGKQPERPETSYYPIR